MITTEQKQQFSDILEELGDTLDITEEQHKDAVESYSAVGDWLSKPDSTLHTYKPDILPHGSFLLGTMIKPINEDDELDIDLVCRLEGKRQNWTQYDIKNIVGKRLKDNGTYEKMLDDEGRRCWTIKYAESRKFHLDILPSMVSVGHQIIEKSLRSFAYEDINELAIRITDNEEPNYQTEPDPDYWPKSNPFGYAKWFQKRASTELKKAILLSERVEPVPAFQKKKLPLQRAIQILKRHRDIMFNGDKDKPISIIITTLAAQAYNKEANITEALLNIVNKMDQYIDVRFDSELGYDIKWISNPVNEEENFADKWPGNSELEANFYKWLNQVKYDINNAISQIGLHKIAEALENPFGKKVVTESFKKYGEKSRKLRESGNLKMASVTGMLGTKGKKVKDHHFYGRDEK